jgi:hypothetical protein
MTRFRLPRPRRSLLLAIVLTAVLAFPLGIAVASHQFSDVPTSNPFHADIGALVTSGVTAGCGGGRYCPSEAVTREQMAAFMNRLGALGPGRVPVVNAARLQGQDANQFHRYNATAPTGRTQVGGFSAHATATGAGNFDAALISFPVPLNAAPNVRVIQPGAGAPSGCSGSVTNPGASPGFLCIFVGYHLNVQAGSYAAHSLVSGLPGTSRFGAALRVSSASSGNFAATGSWAANGTGTLLFDPTWGEGQGLGE